MREKFILIISILYLVTVLAKAPVIQNAKFESSTKKIEVSTKKAEKKINDSESCDEEESIGEYNNFISKVLKL